MISVASRGLSLPFDVEPYCQGDREHAVGQQLKRAVTNLSPRFADYVVVDGAYVISE